MTYKLSFVFNDSLISKIYVAVFIRFSQTNTDSIYPSHTLQNEDGGDIIECKFLFLETSDIENEEIPTIALKDCEVYTEQEIEYGWEEDVLKETGRGRSFFNSNERRKILNLFKSHLNKGKIPLKNIIDEKIKNELRDLLSSVTSQTEKYKKVKGCLVNLLNRKNKLLN